MSRARSAVRPVLALLAVLAVARLSPAQVKYPERPESVDLQLRYRIRADRDERIRQFRALEAHLKKLGFDRKRFPDDELDILDPNAERFEGRIPSKNVFAVLDDPRVRSILFKPTTFQYPDTPDKAVPVRISIASGFLPSDQKRLHGQIVAQLTRLGFRQAVGYDHRAYTLIRGDIPGGNLFRLLKDLRSEPAGWFVADMPTDRLPVPLRDTLPIRAIEVLADADLAHVAPQPLRANRVRFTPDLGALLDDNAARQRPLRVEVVYAVPLDSPTLDALRARLRAAYGATIVNPVTQQREAAFATVDGAAANIVTIRFPATSDAERFVFEPGVMLMRLPRAAGESVTPTMPTGPAAALSSSRLDSLHTLGYRGHGTRIVVIGSEFPDLGAWAGFRFLDKSLNVPVSYIDLTAELSPDLTPTQASGRPGAGTAAARAAHLAAPAASLVLVRVDPASYFQLLTIARFVRGDAGYSEAMQSRIAELSARVASVRQQNAEAAEEYRRAFQNLSDDEGPRLRRERARKALDQIIEEERALVYTIARFTRLQQSLQAMTGAQVVISTLVWESGYPLDGLSELSQVIDTSFASEALATPVNRSATRPRVLPRPLWVQAASGDVGSVWSGPFLDNDVDGAMEFAEQQEPIPAGEWTRALNFLATRGLDGKTTPTLPAGTRLRLTVQWRETHDPTVYGGRESIFPLTLRVLRQLDPGGEKRASDELEEVARSLGGPYPIRVAPTFGVYEQIVELTIPADGRYCLRIEGGEAFDPRLPALRQHIEITPRVFAEFVGTAPSKGRPVFTSFAPRGVGVGIPGDAKAAVTVGTGGPGLNGGGPGLALLPKPDLEAPGTIDTGTGLGGPGVAVGFVGGGTAALIGSGVPAGNLFPATGLKRGGPFVIPGGWLQALPRR